MDKVMCDRKRGKNVSERDKRLLLEIIKLHVNNIECKKHDTKMINKKRYTWKVVTDEFNASSDGRRSEEQLRVLWKDLKAKAKKQKAREIREKCISGGGSQTTYLDDVSKIIIEIVPEVFEEMDSVCDNDATIVNFANNNINCLKTEESCAAAIRDLEGELGPRFDTSVDINADVSMNVYAESSKNALGCKDNRSPYNDQKSNLNHRHEELHKMGMDFLHEEHEQKMSIMLREREMQEEAHALKMDILQSLKDRLSSIPLEGSELRHQLGKSERSERNPSETSE